ncbi:unnamed protein product [Amoebophrya sp. A120]|nr:unnamed protein product [Amoebophrya sp. A120]|eukprot:GSA120T00020244001.1
MLALSRQLYGGLCLTSMVKCADNCGIVKARISAVGRQKKGNGAMGQRCACHVRDKNEAYWGPRKVKGLIVRRRAPSMRKDGSVISFDDNAIVIIKKNKCLGTKIKGPVGYETRHTCKSLARWIF